VTSTSASAASTQAPSPPRPTWPTRFGGPGWRAPVARLVAAPTGGVLMYLACAPRTLWWLAPIAFALLGVVLRGRRWRAGLGLGLLFGLAYFAPLLPWVGIYVGPVPWLALAVMEALFVGLGCALIAVASRLPAAPVWMAALWVATERERSPPCRATCRGSGWTSTPNAGPCSTTTSAAPCSWPTTSPPARCRTRIW
jgi:hypothetical protein